MYEDLFYRRLSELRIAKGVSARDMSLSLGCNPGYINSIENQNGFPKMQEFFYICEYLQVSPKEFFEDGFTYPEQIHELVNLSKHMDHDTLQHLISLMKNMNDKK